MHVIFSHGKESGPNGNKIIQLRKVAEALGCTTESIDYRDLAAETDSTAANMADANARVTRLHERLLALKEPVILVGSSMGGYVSVAAAVNAMKQSPHSIVKALFLLVPAVYMSGYPEIDEPLELPPMSIVHGWKDDIVPYQNSLRLAEKYRADYHLLNDGHRLKEVLPQVIQLFEAFLKSILS